jgi:hypothetical protein
MALIQTIEADKAKGRTKEIYDAMQKAAGVIPAPCNWPAPVPGC